MDSTQQCIVPEAAHNARADVVIAEQLGMTRSQVAKFVKHNRIDINGTMITKAGAKVKAGDTITIHESKYEQSDTDKEIYNEISIIAETDDYLIVNKPSGLLVHPTMKQEPVTLTDWLVQYDSQIAGVGESDVRPGIVHRLDKDASGLLVVAKNQKTFLHLKNQFKKRTVTKYYSVLVHGALPEEKHEHLTFDIDRGTEGKMVARPNTNKLDVTKVTKVQPGKQAHTEFWVEKKFVNYSRLRVQIHSGRTHQIRVHMFAYGHPVVGDTLYKNKKLMTNRDKKLGRIFLHATELAFTDKAGNKQTYNAPLPEKLQTFLQNLT